MTSKAEGAGDSAPPPGSERKFGLLFAAVFAVIALLPLWQGHPVRWWALVIAALCLAAALLAPRTLALPNLLWFRLGEILHKITSPILLGLVFFTTVTPIGWLMRALGKDVLSLKRRDDLSSYWIEREGPASDMKNQF
jgi:hypothetical protein